MIPRTLQHSARQVICSTAGKRAARGLSVLSVCHQHHARAVQQNRTLRTACVCRDGSAAAPQRKAVGDSPSPHTATAATAAPTVPSSSAATRRSGGPVDEYHRLVEAGLLIDDAFQRGIVSRLDRLYQDLLKYSPGQHQSRPEKTSLWKKLLLPKGSSATGSVDMPADVPRGLYIYGDVGTGKTTTMDLFYDMVPTEKKRRVHFHAFMLDVHARINAFRQTKKSYADDPIPTIAKELASSAYVLCFDEFQVTDIADAMVLRRLVTELFRNGVIIVTTSNRHPDELYKNGIQRESFMPCIELLKERCDVISLDSGTDYRKIARETESVYFSPITADTNKVLHALFGLASAGAPVEVDANLHFLGRTLTVPHSANGVARFTFTQLCKEAHSAADYIELAKNYHTIMLTNVPVMHMSDRNEARRFITLIDALYESHAVLIMSSETDIYNLFTGECEVDGFRQSTKGLADQTAGRPGGASSLEKDGVLAYAGEEEVFAFQRAVSRLVEMSSRRWIITGRNSTLAQNALELERNHANYSPSGNNRDDSGGRMRSAA